jgi:YD repeat-containing protein
MENTLKWVRAVSQAIAILFALLLPSAVSATDVWEAHSGDPCCGIPLENYKYLDANEACRVEAANGFNETACYRNPRNLRNSAGPQAQGECDIDVDCVCAFCQTTPTLPEQQTLWAGKVTSKRVQTCPNGTTPYLGRCDQDTAKGKGPCPDCENLARANPLNIGSGNKYQSETVYRAASGQLELGLFYNSQAGTTYFESLAFGAHWTVRYLVAVRDSGQGIVAVHRPDGRDLESHAPASGNLYVNDADIADKLEKLTDGSGTLTGWRYTAEEGDEVEEFDAVGTLLLIRNRAGLQRTMTYSTAGTPPSTAPAAGLLITVTDSFGRQLNFTYNAQKRVNSMTDPAGGQYSFEYDGSGGPAGAGNLTKVTFPDTKTRIYSYKEAAQINGGAACSSPSPVLNNALTGLTDENGSRYATWTYDCQARATSSVHALGVDLYSIDYGTGASTTYLDPLGTSRSAGLQRTLGVARGTGTTQPAASGSGTVSTSATYDANGNIASRTDWNGNRTNYTFDLARNLETSRTEGLTVAGGTTSQTRTISTEWDTNFRLPKRIAEPPRITTNVYAADVTACGARGALCSKTIQATSDVDGSSGFSGTPVGAPRTWTYTYNANGSVLTIDGPRTGVSDVTTYSYYANDDADFGKRGNVATITNAAGHVTSITAYNAHGQPLTIIDPNGLTTTLAYDARQRLTSRTVGTEVTSYEYDGVGQLTKVTLPDASFLTYSYDGAHRLNGMQDNLGNRIAYTLDAMGNRTQEQVYDPANALAQTRSRVYNSLNRLFQELGASSQTTEYGYDNQGNVTSVKDPLNHTTANQYDAVNRLKQVIDPNLGVTQYAYNGLDALTSVADPRSFVTGYAVDGLGNLMAQASPDTGTTSNTYDAAGNLLTQTDAKNQTTTYAYDALNRVTLISFQDGSKQAYAYDQGTNGLGRLSSIAETNPANQPTSLIQYAYEPHGRVISETRTVGGVLYSLLYQYDSFGRLSGLTYPSGRTVIYGFDSLGRVNQVTTAKDSQSQVLVQNVHYHPFGGVKSFSFGNGQTYTRQHDQDGRIASYSLGAQSLAVGYDAASRIGIISDIDHPANANSYGYDSLDRLTSAILPSSNFAYGYDAVGNRVTKTTGANTDTLTYSSTSNRIASLTPASGPARSFVFDANGSTTGDGLNTYAYDTRGRMVQATSSLGATSYQVNALGQRVRKTNSLGDRVFHYDTKGRLIAETDPAGVLKRELFYLGDLPVAVFQ